jgi:hypothetical protein
MVAGGGPRPLSKAVRGRVLKIAREHEALGDVLKGRARPVLIASYPETRVGGEGQALLGVYDYERDRTLVATIDPVRERVLSLDEAPVHLQLSEEEREEAAALAAADERVKRFLLRRPMNPLTRLYFPPGSGRTGTRSSFCGPVGVSVHTRSSTCPTAASSMCSHESSSPVRSAECRP